MILRDTPEDIGHTWYLDLPEDTDDSDDDSDVDPQSVGDVDDTTDVECSNEEVEYDVERDTEWVKRLMR